MDSSTWPFTLAVYEWGPDGTPTKWILAAIFAPGDFSHVNTSVDPPVFYAQPEPLVLHELFNDALVADAPNETPPVRERVLHVGDRVIVRVIEGGYVEGTVTRLSTYPDGAVSDIVQIDSIAGWHGACAWVQS